MLRACSLFLVASTCALAASTGGAQHINTIRVPNGGIQPQVVVDSGGTVHLLYFSGEPKGGDLFYARSADGGATFSSPIRVNSEPRSAIALGSIRGGQMAIGKKGRVHVAWNGSNEAAPKGPVNPETKRASSPMLYSRMNDAKTGFEPQRNLMTRSTDLDGGGTVAADQQGRVWVAWHGHPVAGGAPGEPGRSVYLAASADEGKSFGAETPAWNEPTGACGCCGMKMFAARSGALDALYRAAIESIHRDMYLISSHDGGHTFQGRSLQRWDINACPMSSEDIVDGSRGTLAAWETAGQVYWSAIDDKNGGHPAEPPGAPKNRKHPRLAENSRGETMLVWTEGTGFSRGGSLAWQIFDANGRPADEHGLTAGIPASSFAAVFARPDGGFTILY